MRSLNAVEDFILEGWLPPEPFITPEMKVTAFGSCFAEHISNYLNARNYTILTKSDANAYVVHMGEGMVNSYAIRQQFDWAFRGLAPTTGLWHGYQAEQYDYDENVRRTTLDLFEQTDVFILTFGLSEVWYDEPTGEVFWRAVPADVYDPERHKFRVTTVSNVTLRRLLMNLSKIVAENRSWEQSFTASRSCGCWISAGAMAASRSRN